MGEKIKYRGWTIEPSYQRAGRWDAAHDDYDWAPDYIAEWEE